LASNPKVSKPSTKGSQTCTECKRIKKICEGFRPCSNCVTTGQIDLCFPNRADQNVERPISFMVTTLDFGLDTPWLNAQIRYKWCSQTIRSFWSSGYKLSSLIGLFDSIPPA
jgi:hypothetical protein